MPFKSWLKSRLPKFALEAIRRVRLETYRMRNRKMTTVEVFSQVYADNIWGGEPGEFCSGTGSDQRFAAPYSELVKTMVNRLAAQRGRAITILDLGCGDFRVGRTLVGENVHYIGVDIVPALIDRNTREFAAPGVEFLCLDILQADLPSADICLIRQVLQHLSNEQISQVLARLSRYPQVLITEHYLPDDQPCTPNRDKPHGGDIRLYDCSGVYLDHPPFNRVDQRLVLTVPHDDWGVLRTYQLDQM
ncbi:MAG: class I SAM-dependent methyltransferase [Gemmatimonadaceae bacterium]|jgi:2-polyprenyl-3-methyl-5-hydroxy-6-metoxy-1,4-benzoquinol methylase